jgi:hypothetical protein
VRQATQKEARKATVIILIENNQPTTTKHAIENVTALTTSNNSARLLESLLDTYSPHIENTIWQIKSANPNMRKFETFIFIDRN